MPQEKSEPVEEDKKNATQPNLLVPDDTSSDENYDDDVWGVSPQKK